VLSHEPNSISISEITHLYIAKEYGNEDLRRVRTAIAAEALPVSWKEFLREKATKLGEEIRSSRRGAF
jgi:hypothetical protein